MTYASDHQAARSSRRTDVLGAWLRRASHVVAYLLACMETARQRQALRRLPPEMLKDIGATSADAYAESSRGFWDIPEHLKPR